MTKLLEQAIETLRKLPPQRQDELAEVITMAVGEELAEYTPAQLAAIDEGIRDADAGHFVSDIEVSALFGKYRSA